MPHAFEELTLLPARELHALWQRGTLPPPEAIAGRVFRGRNTSPAARFATGGGAFAKGFFGNGSALRGCNFPVQVNGAEWCVDVSRPYGFFRVEPAGRGAHAGEPAAALLLDYGRGEAAAFRRLGAPSPGLPLRLLELAARPLRDLVVQPPDSPSGLLLGRALFTGRLAVPITYFVLEAVRQLNEAWAAAPAAARPRRRAS